MILYKRSLRLMKKIIKTDNFYINLGIASLIILLLTAFCAAAGLSLIIPLLLALFGYYLSIFRKTDSTIYMQMGLILAIVAAGSHAIKVYTQWPFYIIPIASFPMMIVLLYDDIRLTFLMGLACSLLATLILGVELEYFLIFLISCLVGSYFVRGARNRGQVMKAGFLIAAALVTAGFFLNPVISKEALLHYYEPLALNGALCAGVVIASLKVFETMFGELSNFSLLELSDSLNQPLLKRMAVEAPGTYHHSLVVANLSEAAADAIGANSLLTRVGAYYHDIGKMVKPEYFTENQLMMGNKHDSLEPSMSKLVIINHVKEGVEMAKKHKLSPKMIDFITQHHGTSLLYFFYQKALEEADEDEVVDDSEYRYPGPKPQSRETAVVLLADSVEGATRSLEEHTPKRIDEMVRKIINNKFIDGQLDECDLSLKDLELISSTFSRVLSATYHGRVKYPDQHKSNGNSRKQSSEQAKDQSADYPPADSTDTPSA